MSSKFSDGIVAAKLNKKVTDNPHPTGSVKAGWWRDGFEEAHRPIKGTDGETIYLKDKPLYEKIGK